MELQDALKRMQLDQSSSSFRSQVATETQVASPVTSPIAEAMRSIDKRLDQLRSVIELHQEQLAIALKPEVVASAWAEDREPFGTSPLLAWLDGVDEGLRFLTTRVQALTMGSELSEDRF